MAHSVICTLNSGVYSGPRLFVYVNSIIWGGSLLFYLFSSLHCLPSTLRRTAEYKQNWGSLFEFYKPLTIWPGLLEAWLVLTSVKYHGNLYILIPLNQRLALTRLRATGPWTPNKHARYIFPARNIIKSTFMRRWSKYKSKIGKRQMLEASDRLLGGVW